MSGDHVTCQGAGVVLSGVVERVTPMRTYIRTDDDVIVTVPNKVRECWVSADGCLVLGCTHLVVRDYGLDWADVFSEKTSDPI